MNNEILNEILKSHISDHGNNVISVDSEISSFDESYIDFLNCQINLNARGDERTKILRDRKIKLIPYINKKLMRVSIHCVNGFRSIRYDLNAKIIVCDEWDESL